MDGNRKDHKEKRMRRMMMGREEVKGDKEGWMMLGRIGVKVIKIE